MLDDPRTRPKDFRVQVRIRNNRLLERREALGLNQHEAALAIGLNVAAYGAFETLSRKPVENGQWHPHALLIAEYYDCPVEELFPESVLAIETANIERKVNAADLRPMLVSQHTERLALPPGDRSVAEELQGRIDVALTSLPPRRAKILREHFGLDEPEKSQKDIADENQCSRGNISIIVRQSLWKLRKSSRCRKLLTDLSDDDLFWNFELPKTHKASVSPLATSKDQFELASPLFLQAFTLFGGSITTRPVNTKQRWTLYKEDGPIIDLFRRNPELNDEFRRFRLSLFKWFPQRTRLGLRWGFEGDTELLLLCVILIRPTTKMLLRAVRKCEAFWKRSPQGQHIRWRLISEDDGLVTRRLRSADDLVREAKLHGFEHAHKVDDQVLIRLPSSWSVTEQSVHLRCCFQDRATVVKTVQWTAEILLKLGPRIPTVAKPKDENE